MTIVYAITYNHNNLYLNFTSNSGIVFVLRTLAGVIVILFGIVCPAMIPVYLNKYLCRKQKKAREELQASIQKIADEYKEKFNKLAKNIK